jgi:hypothetical protein
MRRSGQPQNVPIVLGEIAGEGSGVGGYYSQEIGHSEAGFFGFSSAGPLSLGGGGGVSSTGTTDLFVFSAVEVPTSPVELTETATLYGLTFGPAGVQAYHARIYATGNELGLPGQHASVVSGIEQITPIHPLDALFQAFDSVVSGAAGLLEDTVHSVIGPMADPANNGDPIQSALDRRVPKPQPAGPVPQSPPQKQPPPAP